MSEGEGQVGEGRGVWKFSELSAQFCCEPYCSEK